MTTVTEQKKQLIQLYNHSDLKVNEIIREMGISQTRFYKLRKQVKHKLKQRPKGRPPKQLKPIRNYSFNHTTNNYDIRKRGIYYGSVKTHKQAERLVELLEQSGWQKELARELKKQAIKEFQK